MASEAPESPHSINKRPKDDVSDDEKGTDEKAEMLPKTMTALRCSTLGPIDDTLKLTQSAVPTLKPTQILIKVLFASINPIDWKITTGRMGPLNPLKCPLTAGSDFSGRVVAKGKDAGDAVAVGDIVYGQSWTEDGSFAEYCVCRGSDVRKAPESMSALEASAMPMVCQTSYQALLKGKLSKGQKLLVLGGTTSTGMAAIQLAKCAPFEAGEVLATSSREELCTKLGADRVINYRKETWTDSLKDYGVDVIYDCVGGQDSWDLCRKQGVLKKNGHYVTIVGDAKGGKQNTYGTMVGAGLSIANRKFWGALGNQKYDFIVCDPTSDLDDITKLIDAGKVVANLDPDSPYKFEDWRAMYQKSMDGKARGKLVIEISSVDTQTQTAAAAANAADEKSAENSDAPQFRITYFATAGRGEPLRLAAALGGIAFEDRFISRDDFNASKEKGERRWSGVPEISILGADGQETSTIGQSNACIRYIGSLGGLYPTNPLLRALCDEVMDSAEDFVVLAAGAAFGGDDAKKDEVCTDESKLPYWLGKFEARLTENAERGSQKGGFVGDAYTVADCKFFSSAPIVKMLPKGAELIAKYEKVSAFLEEFAEDEKVKAFREKFQANVEQFKADKSNDFKYTF